MLWFTVWTLLVLATVVGAFFLLRHVYRSGKALVLELQRAAEVMGELADRADELAAQVEAMHPLAPVDLSDPEPARRRRQVTLAAKARRQAARAARHEAVYRRWQSFSR